MRTEALSILCVLAAVGCNDSLDQQGLTAGSGQFAVLSDNYTGAASISLLDDMGKVSKAEWVGSRTENAKLRTPLSEDVVLTTVSTELHYLTAIERSLGVLTRFDIGNGDVLGQLRTDDSPQDDKAAYHSNPQDVLYISDDSAWVTRWRQNPDGSAAERERGNDLIEWSPKTFKRSERRIDLSDLNEDIDEVQLDKDGNATGTATATAYASPTSLVPVGGFVAVGITGITLNYNYGPGKLAIVDLNKARRVSVLELEGLTNCAEVRPVADDFKSVIVSCAGGYGDSGEHTGLLKISVDDAGTARITGSYRKTDHQEQRTITGNVASVGGNIVVAVAPGHIDTETMQADETDRLVRVDLASGKTQELLKSKGAFALGTPAFAVKAGLLIIPDAGGTQDPSTGVHRFVVTIGRDVKRVDFVEVASDTGLAARQVLAL